MGNKNLYCTPVRGNACLADYFFQVAANPFAIPCTRLYNQRFTQLRKTYWEHADNVVRGLGNALDRRTSNGRLRRRAAALGALRPAAGWAGAPETPGHVAGRRRRGGCGAECLRQFLPGCPGGPLRPTPRPQRPLATAGR